jgi:hypothetical protein
MQLPVLLEELDRLIAGVQDSEHRERLTALSRFLSSGLGEVHTYVKFIGD